jgi:hypothetical protein
LDSGTEYWTKTGSTTPHKKKFESQQMVELLLNEMKAMQEKNGRR